MKKEKERRYFKSEYNISRFDISYEKNIQTFDTFIEAVRFFLELKQKHKPESIATYTPEGLEDTHNIAEILETRYNNVLKMAEKNGHTIDELRFTVTEIPVHEINEEDRWSDGDTYPDVTFSIEIFKSRPCTTKEMDSKKKSSETRNRKAELEKTKRITKLEKELKRLKK
jgi:hypothetical protein